MQLNEYRQQSEYCFMSLSEQLWQYRERRKPEVGTILYSYRMTSTRALYSAQYYRQHCELQAFGQFEALYIHNLDDTHPTRPRLETTRFEPQLDRMSHRGRQILYCQQFASPGECVLMKKLIDRNMAYKWFIDRLHVDNFDIFFIFLFFGTFFMRRESVIRNNENI